MYSRNTGLPDNNQERRPITIELNLNAVTLCGGESLCLCCQVIMNFKSAPLIMNYEKHAL